MVSADGIKLSKLKNSGPLVEFATDRHARAKIQQCGYIYSAPSVHIVDSVNIVDIVVGLSCGFMGSQLRELFAELN